jgi:hypothetical protein
MTYSPQYIGYDEIPVQVPDEYSKKEKGMALELAESSIELDLNDGTVISSDSFTSMMAAAVKQKATCELVKGADDPNDVTLGDLSDEGTNKQDYSEVFCDRYDEIIAKLQQAGVLEGGANQQDPYVYTTSDPTPSDEYQERNPDPDSWST